jgi:hypothetical protein
VVEALSQAVASTQREVLSMQTIVNTNTNVNLKAKEWWVHGYSSSVVLIS